PQSRSQARAAVSAPALLKDRFDAPRQLLVGPSTHTLWLVLMGVKTAGGNFQRLGQFLDLIISLELVHELEALFRLPSETMAKAFFKISRCRRRYSISCLSRRFSRCSALSLASVKGWLCACPLFLRATQCRSDQMETPISLATSTIGRPELTRATAFSLNSAS